MRQAYISPDMTFVRLKHRDIITDSPQTLSVFFDEEHAANSASEIGAADRYRDWE